jgi:hypothetical protein
MLEKIKNLESAAFGREAERLKSEINDVLDEVY